MTIVNGIIKVLGCHYPPMGQKSRRAAPLGKGIPEFGALVEIYSRILHQVFLLFSQAWLLPKDLFIFYFLASPLGMQDLSSPTRDQTHVPCIGSLEFLTTGWSGKSLP